MIIKIVVDFLTSMCVCSKCNCLLMSQQVLVCIVKPSLVRLLRLCLSTKTCKECMVWNFVVNCWDNFSLLYLLSRDNSATHLPSVWSWKGCLLWLLAFDLKVTKLNWIQLKYFTCSLSTCNSCSSQNNGRLGSLQVTHPKVKRTG